MPQKDFRIAITHDLLLTPDSNSRSSEDDAVDEDFDRPRNLPRVSGEHLIIKQADGKQRRCKRCRKPAVYICQKCNIHLHIKCIAKYHEELPPTNQ